MRYHQWNKDALNEALMSDLEGQKVKAGISLPPGADTQMGESNLCIICYSEATDFENMKCGHKFCSNCWHEYFKEKLKTGPGCVFAKCMMNKCPLSVSDSMWKKILANDDANFKTYHKFHCKNFTDDNKNVQWCPRPGCNYAV